MILPCRAPMDNFDPVRDFSHLSEDAQAPYEAGRELAGDTHQSGATSG